MERQPNVLSHSRTQRSKIRESVRIPHGGTSPDRRVQGRKAEAQGQMPCGLPDGASEAETAASGTGDTSGKRREEAFAGDRNVIMVIKL